MTDTACQLCQIFLMTDLHFHAPQNISLSSLDILRYSFILQELSVLVKPMHLNILLYVHSEHSLFCSHGITKSRATSPLRLLNTYLKIELCSNLFLHVLLFFFWYSTSTSILIPNHLANHHCHQKYHRGQTHLFQRIIVYIIKTKLISQMTIKVTFVFILHFYFHHTKQSTGKCICWRTFLDHLDLTFGGCFFVSGHV